MPSSLAVSPSAGLVARTIRTAFWQGAGSLSRQNDNIFEKSHLVATLQFLHCLIVRGGPLSQWQ
jgi:hypothetical protein